MRARILGVVVLMVGTLGCSTQATPPAPVTTPDAQLSQPSPTSAALPANLAELPTGDAPRVPYLAGKQAIIDGKAIPLGFRASWIVVGRAISVVGSASAQRMARIDDKTITVSPLALDDITERGIADAHQNFIAWPTAAPGDSEVALYSLNRPPLEPLDRQTFPTRSECCDDPFVVVGFDHRYLYVENERDGAWTWDIYEGQEGIPNEVPDSDKYVRRIKGLGRSTVVQVTENEVVVHHEGSATFGIGVVDRGTYRETEQVTAGSAYFADPKARRVIVWEEGLGFLRARTSGPGARGSTPAEVPLALPESLEINSVAWENSSAFLVSVSDGKGSHAIVRCETKDGRCELAADLKSQAYLPRD